MTAQLFRHPLLSLVVIICVAVLAAGQPQSLLKWSQPPEPVTPQDVYLGWNERSDWWLGPVVADDWICTTPDPVTDVHWWGSFLGWNVSTPPQLPSHFHIQFWTDVPTSPGGFSHPGVLIHEVVAYNYTWQWVWWDFDPRLGEYEACYRFDYQMTPMEYFYQSPTGDPTVYWISIAACDGGGAPGPHPFGWKTLPHIDSGGPDCAVRIWQPIQPSPGSQYQSGETVWWPDEFHQWDMAFELTTLTQSAKLWDQPPELAPIGTDVNASHPPGAPVPYILADDFLCTTTGPVNEIVIFGSWYHDMVPPPPEILFSLSIHADIPAPPGGYSMPGAPLWWRTFGPGEYIMEPFVSGFPEGWLNPPDWYEPMADTICWIVRFPLLPGEFIQTGTPENPVIYWLDLHVDLLAGPANVMFGWKTSLAHWNDLAVWALGLEPYPGPWQPLIPPQLPPVDLAFQIIGQGGQPGVKWSQPPMPFMPDDAYNGWDQLSEYGVQLAADDWVCTTDNPVTDLHWWGSFLGWAHPFPPPLPHAFHIGIWTDVPADPAQPGSFSHPGVLLWQNYCDTYAVEFVGWDFDPRQIDGLSQSPEATFRFTQLLEPDTWFWQEPGENIYWLSIAALPCDCDGDLNADGVINLMDLALLANCFGQFPGGACARADLTCDGSIDAQDAAALQCLMAGNPPSQCCPGYTPDAPLFGWKTRPRNASPAPDDAVAIFAPTAPVPGDAYELGMPLYYPTPAVAWDLAFELTSVPRDRVICEPQGGAANPFHPPDYWYDVTIDDPGLGRCDFHVRVFDPNPANYTNPSLPPTWQFAVHQLPNGEWWASWWDPDCSHALFNTTFRFQFNNPNPNTWGEWTTTISATSDPYDQPLDLAANHAHQPDGYGYRVHVPQVLETYVKWAQPPTRKSQFPEFFYGWNEPSLYFGPQLVADDFKCCDPRPISDVHWWGSYLNWLEPVPPPVQPSRWHIGLWTDVPVGPGQPWSHPGILIHEWIVPAAAVAMEAVGFDFHPEYGVETCFRYDLQFPNAEWFYQPDFQEIFWISIGAIYDFGPPEHVWGWKTRQPKWHDDAVRIFAPLPPALGASFQAGMPIENGEGSWDMAFSLTTPVPPPPICIGDIDGSGFVDFGDINPFVLRLSNPVAYRDLYPCVPDAHSDIDQNGAVDFGDINPFVALLSNNPLPIPCP